MGKKGQWKWKLEFEKSSKVSVKNVGGGTPFNALHTVTRVQTCKDVAEWPVDVRAPCTTEIRSSKQGKKRKTCAWERTPPHTIESHSLGKRWDMAGKEPR